MTNIETLDDWWKYVVDYLNEKKVTFFVHGSTLLQSVRTKNFTERQTFDRELNFGMRAEDISAQFLSDLKKDFPYFNATGDKKDNALIYFGPEPIIKYLSINKDHWSMKPGIALIATFWKADTKWVEYMGGDVCLTWPRFQLDQLSVMEVNGRRVATPFDKHAWLSHYFGDDYMIENQGWHWSQDSHNRETYEDMVQTEHL